MRRNLPRPIDLCVQLLVRPQRVQVREVSLGKASRVIEGHVIVEALVEVDEQMLDFVLDELALEDADITQRPAKADDALFQIGDRLGVLEQQPDAEVARVRKHLEHRPRGPALASGRDESFDAVDALCAARQIFL